MGYGFCSLLIKIKVLVYGTLTIYHIWRLWDIENCGSCRCADVMKVKHFKAKMPWYSDLWRSCVAH